MDAPTRALRPPDATAPDTEFPDAATRHEPPDAPRSGKKLSRVHPARDALTLAAPRLSPPRRKIRAVPLPRVRGPVSPRAPRPCRATLPLGSGRNNLARLRAEPILRRAQNVFLRRSRQLPHLVQSCSDQPDGEIKAPGFSQPHSEKCRNRWTTRGDPPLRAEAAQRRRFRRASGTSSIGSRPQNARNVRREFHKPFREPFQRLAHPNGSAAPSRRADTGAQRLTRRASSKNIPAFKLENPSAAEAGDGNESTKEIPYLPSFLRRVRTVSDSSAPLPTQA